MATKLYVLSKLIMSFGILASLFSNTVFAGPAGDLSDQLKINGVVAGQLAEPANDADNNANGNMISFDTIAGLAGAFPATPGGLGVVGAGGVLLPLHMLVANLNITTSPGTGSRQVVLLEPGTADVSDIITLRADLNAFGTAIDLTVTMISDPNFAGLLSVGDPFRKDIDETGAFQDITNLLFFGFANPAGGNPFPPPFTVAVFSCTLEDPCTTACSTIGCSIPEPETMALVGTGALALIMLRRRKGEPARS